MAGLPGSRAVPGPAEGNTHCRYKPCPGGLVERLFPEVALPLRPTKLPGEVRAVVAEAQRPSKGKWRAVSLFPTSPQSIGRSANPTTAPPLPHLTDEHLRVCTGHHSNLATYPSRVLSAVNDPFQILRRSGQPRAQNTRLPRHSGSRCAACSLARRRPETGSRSLRSGNEDGRCPLEQQHTLDGQRSEGTVGGRTRAVGPLSCEREGTLHTWVGSWETGEPGL